MTTLDPVADLRARLAGQQGRARLNDLLKLGALLADQYWRAGPGQPAALPSLNAAIETFDEAYRLVELTDPLRGTVAAQLGVLLGARNTTHAPSDHDRETGIHVLEEALSFPDLPPVLRATVQVHLGQLCVARVSGALTRPGFAMSAMREGVPPDAAADADRAVACFRAVVDGPPVSADITNSARTLLEIAEAMQAMVGSLGGGIGGMDLARMAGMMGTLQQFQDRYRVANAPGAPAATAFGPGSISMYVDADRLAATDPLDRPAAVMESAEPVGPGPQVRRAAEPAPPDLVELRASLAARFATAAGADVPGPVWAVAAVLLLPAAPVLDADTVDELVALAQTVVDQAPDGDQGAAAVDWFLLAVALHLRHRTGDAGGGDRAAAADALLTAARQVPPDHPATVTVLRSAGVFLDEDAPLTGPVETVAGRLADRFDAVLAAGAVRDPADLATLHALRCLCRTAEAAADLRRAAGTVPLDYPWLAAVRAAGAAVG